MITNLYTKYLTKNDNPALAMAGLSGINSLEISNCYYIVRVSENINNSDPILFSSINTTYIDDINILPINKKGSQWGAPYLDYLTFNKENYKVRGLVLNINPLEYLYKFENTKEINQFLSQNYFLMDSLVESKKQILAIFGSDIKTTLELYPAREDNEWETLLIDIWVKGSFEDAYNNLSILRDNWLFKQPLSFTRIVNISIDPV